MPPPKVHTTIEVWTVWDRRKDLHKEAPKHNSADVQLQNASKSKTCTKSGTNLLNRLYIDPNTLSIRTKTTVQNKSKTLNKRLSQKQRTWKDNKRGKGQEREGDAKTSLQ
jgi:hypothetical protein